MTGLEIMQLVRRYCEPMRRRIAGMVGRCIIQTVYDSQAGSLQGLQVTALGGDPLDQIDKIQQYGFTSNPKPGAEGVIVFPAGDRSHGIVIAVDDRRYRLVGLQSGEVALYTDEGDYAWFKRGRKLHFRSNGFNFTGSSDELMDLLAQLSQQVENIANTLNTDTTNTMFGPMKLNGFATYGTIKSAVDTIRGKIVAMTG